MLYKRFKQSIKQKQIIEKQKQLVDEKQIEIIDSINYAKRIQNAILPPRKNLTNIIPESFILFKPKDIVSGDFYWFEKIKRIKNISETELIIVAAADCTGHGVPGAFMSVIGNNLLTEIIKGKGITKPSEILDTLNEQVQELLKQRLTGAETNEGMDVCLCTINFRDSIIEYAGANRPLYIYRNMPSENNFEEIKPSKIPVGGNQFYKEGLDYQNYTLHFRKGDTFYLFSDGYCDQFGGEDDKKFMSKRFRELLQKIQNLKMSEQEEILISQIEKWMKNEEQTDDILIIGLRL